MIEIWPIKKNLQFLSYHHETWSKRPPLGLVILTKFHDDSSKIVDFLLLVKFLSFPVFYGPVSMVVWSSHFFRQSLKNTLSGMVLTERRRGRRPRLGWCELAGVHGWIWVGVAPGVVERHGRRRRVHVHLVVKLLNRLGWHRRRVTKAANLK